MVNKRRLINLTRKLLRIRSENPPGEEYKIAMAVRQYLRSLGLEVSSFTFGKNRPNIIGVLKAKCPKFSLLLSPHLDTVPAGRNWKYNPYQAKIIGGRIYARGATDCKGNLAAGLEAINSIAEDKIKLDYDIIFAATVDEETGSRFGLIPLLKKRILRPTFALVLDASGFDVIVAQKGLIHFKVTLFGRKAHGAYPHQGINAIEVGSRIITALKSHRFKYRLHPLLKPPTINIGTISGGDKVNIVADWCQFSVDFRFLPGMNPNQVLKQIRKIISKYIANFRIDIENIQKPYQISKDNPLVKSLACAIRKIRGVTKLKGSEGATVITFFQEANIPAIATGFGVSGMSHTTNEYVNIDDLVKGAKALEEFLRMFNNANG